MIVINAPYPEAAIRAISIRAAAERELAMHFSRGSLRRPARPTARGTADATDADHAAWGVSSTPLAHLNEMVRLASKAGRFPPAVQVALMYRQYARFDRLAAGRLAQDGQTLFGLPGGCLQGFRRNHAFSGFNVFHAVNAHPLAHNAALLEHHDRAGIKGELIPAGAIARVTRELDIADLVLSPSQTNTAGLTRFGVDPEKIVTVGYGVDLDRFTVSTFVKGTDTRSDAVRFLFVGQMSFRKGTDTLLDAMRILGSGFHLTMVGPVVSPGVLSDVPANVRLCGPVSQERLAGLYNEVDAFVLPSVEDACALVTFEAAATGLPVVTTRENGASEYLESNILRFADVCDAASLAAALAGMTRLEHGTRSRNRVELLDKGNVLTWSEYAGRVLSRVRRSAAARH